MAAGPATPYREGLLRIVRGEVLLLTHTLKAAYVDNAYTPDVGVHDDWSQVSANEISAAGYTAGGQTLTNVAITEDSGEIKVDADDIDYTSVSFSARYMVIYDDTTTPKYLISYIDLNDGGAANISSTSSDFDVNFAATGIMRFRDATP